MRCFNHPTNDAAGVCRNCGRGICRDCIAMSEDAVACKGRCEARVAAIQRMIQGNQTNYRTTARLMHQGGIYSFFAGILFIAMGGIFSQFVGNDFGMYLGALFAVLGILILIRGISAIRSSRTYAQMARDAADQPVTTEHFR